MGIKAFKALLEQIVITIGNSTILYCNTEMITIEWRNNFTNFIP